MSALRQPRQFISVDAYLQIERASQTRSEYVNGCVYAMAGGREAHNLIVTNLTGLIWSQLRQRPCKAFGPDMKVRIDKANAFRYPDVSGVCGPVLFHDPVQDAYCNPSFIIEVLSPSTELQDRGEKFTLYRLLESLRHYVLVCQDRVQVEVFSSSQDGNWDSILYNELSDFFELMGCQISLFDVYEKVAFP